MLAAAGEAHSLAPRGGEHRMQHSMTEHARIASCCLPNRKLSPRGGDPRAPCRAAELVVSDASVVKEPQFQSISVSANLWMPIREVPGQQYGCGGKVCRGD